MNMQSLKDYAEINSTVATTSTPPTTNNTSLISAVRVIAKNQAYAEKNQDHTD